jgi:hypothetical protein
MIILQANCSMNPSAFVQGIQVLFMPLDCSGPDGLNCATIQLIDSIPVNIRIPVGTRRPETQYIGSAGLVQLNVSFEVTCTEDFYGGDCRTFCPDFESCVECGLSGYTGEFCQFNIDDCEGIECNNGECIDELNGFACECELGFTGNQCQHNIDDCNETSCNNGECVDGINSFACECESGFTGDSCEDDINDCEGVDCNDGMCVDEVGGFTCDCNPGFTGGTCNEINHCHEVTCGNGRCETSPEGFTCVCVSGFSGDLCTEQESELGWNGDTFVVSLRDENNSLPSEIYQSKVPNVRPKAFPGQTSERSK